MGDIKDRLEEWAVRVTFAEADEAAAGFEATGEKLDRNLWFQFLQKNEYFLVDDYLH